MTCRQDGFTLVELLVGMALMAMVMATLGGMLTAFLGHGVQGVEEIQRQQEARWVLDMIVQDVQYAREYKSGKDAGSFIEIVKKDSRDQDVRIRYYLQDAGKGNHLLRRRVWVPATAGTVTDDSQVSNTDYGYVGATDFLVTPGVEELVTADDQKKTVVTHVSLLYQIRRGQADASPKTAQTTVYFPNYEQLTL